MIYEIEIKTSVDLAEFIKAIRREIECQNGVEDVTLHVFRDDTIRRGAGAIRQDNDLFAYPHIESVERAIRSLDQACERRTCDDCPLSLGFCISHDLRSEPTECVGTLLANMYERYQIDKERKV